MTKINLAEMNEADLSRQTVYFKEEMAEKMEVMQKDKPALNSNEIAKQVMATELLKQGLSEKAVCRILNISAQLLPGKLEC